jgi:ribulose-phosphate 3-epimerase
MKGKILAPSLLSSDFSDLKSAVKLCEEKGAGLIHIDVMDGHFVPQITYGQPVIKSIRSLTKLPFDVHLMVERPDEMTDSFIDAGADWITFHQEACVHIDRLINHIHERGKKAGISIVPSTPVSAIKEILPLVDLVLVMTVNPGFGGQKLIPYCTDKIAELSEIRRQKGYKYLISADGGVNSQTAGAVLDAGADIVVSGSAFFNGSFEWEA